MKSDKEKVYSTGEVAKMLGVAVRTVQGWDYDGRFKARRMPSGRRYYTQEDVDKLLGNSASDHKEKRFNIRR